MRCEINLFVVLTLGRFTTTGRKKKGERQRMYTYALVDAVDAPYVTFRYIFRTNGKCKFSTRRDCI